MTINNKDIPREIMEEMIRFAELSREINIGLEMIVRLKKMELEVLENIKSRARELAIMKSRINSFNVIGLPKIDKELKDKINLLFRKHRMEGFRI